MGSNLSSEDLNQPINDPTPQKISGRIINDQIIEYDHRINYSMIDVTPNVRINDQGFTTIEFIDSITNQRIPVSQLQISETISLGLRTITLHVAPKPKKRSWWKFS